MWSLGGTWVAVWPPNLLRCPMLGILWQFAILHLTKERADHSFDSFEESRPLDEKSLRTFTWAPRRNSPQQPILKQGRINCGPSSQSDFIQNYFLCEHVRLFFTINAVNQALERKRHFLHSYSAFRDSSGSGRAQQDLWRDFAGC